MHVKDQKWFWFEDGSYVNESPWPCRYKRKLLSWDAVTVRLESQPWEWKVSPGGKPRNNPSEMLLVNWSNFRGHAPSAGHNSRMTGSNKTNINFRRKLTNEETLISDWINDDWVICRELDHAILQCIFCGIFSDLSITNRDVRINLLLLVMSWQWKQIDEDASINQ